MKRLNKILTALIVIVLLLLLLGNKGQCDTYSHGNFVISEGDSTKICEVESVEYYLMNSQGEEVFLKCDSITGVIKQLTKSFEINLVDTDSGAVQMFGAFNKPPIKFIGKTVYFGKSFFMSDPNHIHEISYVTYENDSVIELHDLSQKTIIKFQLKE